MRGGYTSLPHTNTRITLTDMRGKTWTRRRRRELQHGKIKYIARLFASLHAVQQNQWCCLNRCDRILWYGRGLSQLSYVRGESRFSDHRPVYSMFSAEVESINHSRIQKMSSSSSQLDIEELLPYSYGYTDINPYGYTDLNFYWNGFQSKHFCLEAKPWEADFRDSPGLSRKAFSYCSASSLPATEGYQDQGYTKFMLNIWVCLESHG